MAPVSGTQNGKETGAGEGNRTLVVSLGSFCSTIELHPLFKHLTVLAGAILHCVLQLDSCGRPSDTLIAGGQFHLGLRESYLNSVTSGLSALWCMKSDSLALRRTRQRDVEQVTPCQCTSVVEVDKHGQFPPAHRQRSPKRQLCDVSNECYSGVRPTSVVLAPTGSNASARRRATRLVAKPLLAAWEHRALLEPAQIFQRRLRWARRVLTCRVTAVGNWR